MRRLKDDTDGMIMIEGLIVFAITTFLLMLVIALFGVLFQYWNIQTLANDTAAKLAQTYQYSESDWIDMRTGEIDNVTIGVVRPYRYIWNKSELINSAKERAEEYIEEEFRKFMLISIGSKKDVKTEIVTDFLGRRHVEVTVTVTFMTLFQNALEFIGYGKLMEYTVTGYADCTDLLDYLNTVDFVAHASDPNHWGKSKIIKILDNLLSLIGKFLS